MKKKAKSAVEKRSRELKIPFGLKLTFIVTSIILGTVWIIIALVAAMVSLEFVRTTEETNFVINSRAAYGIEERLYKVRSEALLLLEMNSVVENNSAQIRQLRSIFFERNPYIGAVTVPGVEEIINRPFFTYNEIPLETLSTWLTRESRTIERAKAGEPVLRNVTPVTGIHLLALFYPWQNTGFKEAAVIFFSPQNLSEITGAGSNTTVVVNEEGDILISPNFNQVLEGANMAAHTLFETLWKDTGESIRMSFTEGGNRYVGAGHRISIANAAVFTFLEYSIINEQISSVSRRNILLSVTVMFLSIMVTWFYSRIITTPVKRLIAAAGQIERGEFEPDLKKKSSDELGILTERFIAMGKGLSRWEEIKNLVGRYNNRGITDKVIAGEVNLKGEYLPAVVLSVDLVSFYTNFEAAETGSGHPLEALDHLNFLISKVADNVEKTGGVMDKVTGTGLIAVWGVPVLSEDISNEIMNSLRTAIMIRNVLWDLNTDQESQGKPLYMIHCGIHFGNVLAGNLGTSRYHQYTVAGRTVDLAVKAAEACEPAKTDIIITEAVREMAGEQILAEGTGHIVFQNSNFPVFGLVNLAPQGNEKQRWPYTLKDIQESLRGKETLQQRNK